jgi:site-specific DNA-methyltransferase (adenine-specific)
MVDVIHGDARAILPTITQTVDLVLTDPPFGISNLANASGASSAFSGYTSDKGAWDVEIPAEEWVPQTCRVLRDGGMFVVFGTFGSLVPIFLELKKAGMRFQSHITWHKTNPAPSIHRRMLTHANEIILVFSKGSHWTFDYEYSKTITGKQMHNHVEMDELCFDVAAVRKVLDVTRKPLILCDRLVRLFSKPGDLVLDPFAGSGAILEAAVGANRRAIAIEVQEKLCEHMRKTFETSH